MRKLMASAAVVSCLLVGHAAFADAPPQMSFLYTRSDLRMMDMGIRETVYADGVVTPGTAERLRAFLQTHEMLPGSSVMMNSPGGNLEEGMKLGLLIRGLSLSTDVGVFPKKIFPIPGYCYSACTIAFLGGERRYLLPGSQFGVHRFSAPGTKMTGEDAIDEAQIVSGALVEYVKEMGIDPGFIHEMSKRGPTDLNILGQDQLRDLNVVTKTYQTTWEIKDSPEGEFYVVGATTDIRGVHKILMSCPRRPGMRPFIMAMYNISASGARDTIGMTKDLALNIDDHDYIIPESEIEQKPLFSHGYISVVIDLNRRQEALLETAKELGFSMLHFNGETFTGFQGDFVSGREKVLGFLKACNLPR